MKKIPLLSLLLGGLVTSFACMADGDHAAVCTGTLLAPGTLAGTYHSDVVVNGICFVNGGPAIILGNLTVSPGSALIAVFGLNDTTGVPLSRPGLTIAGNVNVQKGATLVAGCEPTKFPCGDDTTNPPNGSLTETNLILGNIIESQPLGVVLHKTTILGNVTSNGGGGGLTCTPTGIFAAFGSPVYSDYEDIIINGNLSVTGLQTCWYGIIRDTVQGNVTDANNTAADPDANETHSNTIFGSLSCNGNNPKVQFGDGYDLASNVVGKNATGECGFNVILPDPLVPPGPLTPISIKIPGGKEDNQE